MRYLVILLTVLFLPVCSWGQETLPSEEQKPLPSKEMKVGSETVQVYYAVSKYYLLRKLDAPKGSVPFEATFGFIRLQHNGKNLDQNRFLTQGETKTTFQFQSSDESVLHVTNSTRDTGFPYEPGTVIARKPGRVVVTVTADKYEVKIPITIHGLPIFKGDAASLVALDLGEPDEVSGGRNVEYWFYDRYPDLCLKLGKGNMVTETTHPYSLIARIGIVDYYNRNRPQNTPDR